MIKIRIETKDTFVADEFTQKDVTLIEVALALHKLELAKQKLLEFEFDNGVEFKADA